jgi:hypothetical protein
LQALDPTARYTLSSFSTYWDVAQQGAQGARLSCCTRMASGNLSSLRSLHAGSPSESSDIQQQRGGLWESLKFETNDAGAALYLTTPSSRIPYAVLIRGMSASVRVTSHESPIRLTHTAVVVIMIVDSCSSAVNLNYNPVSQMKSLCVATAVAVPAAAAAESS